MGVPVRVVVTATDALGQTGTARSGPFKIDDGFVVLNQSPPRLSTTSAGSSRYVTALRGEWGLATQLSPLRMLVRCPATSSGDTGVQCTFAVQWQRCAIDGTGCVDIPGATGAQIDSSQVGNGRLRAVETATIRTPLGETLQASAASDAIGSVPPPVPRLGYPVAIGGTAKVGERLTSAPGQWNSPSQLTFRYRWLRCDFEGNDCAPVPDAVGKTYQLRPADAGFTIAVEETVTDLVGQKGTEVTAAIGPVVP